MPYGRRGRSNPPRADFRIKTPDGLWKECARLAHIYTTVDSIELLSTELIPCRDTNAVCETLARCRLWHPVECEWLSRRWRDTFASCLCAWLYLAAPDFSAVALCAIF